MIDIRRHKRGTITIRPVLQLRIETTLDYYRRKAAAEMARDLKRDAPYREKQLLEFPDLARAMGLSWVSNRCQVWRTSAPQDPERW